MKINATKYDDKTTLYYSADHDTDESLLGEMPMTIRALKLGPNKITFGWYQVPESGDVTEGSWIHQRSWTQDSREAALDNLAMLVSIDEIEDYQAGTFLAMMHEIKHVD